MKKRLKCLEALWKVSRVDLPQLDRLNAFS